MKAKLYPIVLITAVLVAGCGEAPSNKPPQASVTAPAAVDGAQQAADAAKGQAGGDAVLIDGTQPLFTHKVRSSRDMPQADGSVTHSLNAEFMSIDATGVEQSLRQTFESKGYVIVGPKEKDGIMKFVANGTEGKRILYSITPVGPALKVKLASADAQGLVAFIWTDAAK